MKTRLGDAVRGWWQARPTRRYRARHDRIMADAYLERHGRLVAIYLAGSPYEMGYQHGVLARDLIHGFRKDAYAYIEPQIPAPRLVARPLLFHHTAAYWPTISAQLATEMRGIAHGAGVHMVEVLLATAIWEIFHAHGCSQFAAVSPELGGSSLIHGYNYDLMDPQHALIQPYLALIFYRPDEGIPFVTLNTAGSVGVNGGMNEAGISVAWDNTYLRDRTLTAGIGSPVVPFIVTLRTVLQYTHTIDQAIQVVLSSLPRPLADIIIVGSAREARAVGLETAGHRHAIREMDENRIWSTNCFRSPQLAPFDRRGDAASLSGAELWRRFPRYCAYRDLLHDLEAPLTPEGAASYLRDPYPREARGHRHPVRGSGSTICRDITSWSLVMEPGQGHIWASDPVIPGCQGRLFAFDLRRRQARPDLDIPATGYPAAHEVATAFLEGDALRCQTALDQSLKLDGSTAPLLLMQALLAGCAGDTEGAASCLSEIVATWEGTPAALLAQSWLSEHEATKAMPIPFPSATHPTLLLLPAPDWPSRAVPGIALSKQGTIPPRKPSQSFQRGGSVAGAP